nr:reverse transcriptase domain-containing protein [Providencia sp. PROV111]
MVTLVLETRLPVHPACEHIKGHGGGQQSVHRLDRMLQNGGTPFVCRTDIQGYYQHINKSRLLRQLEPYLNQAGLFNVVTQFVHYSVEDGGVFHTPTSGISRGSALSPLLAAFHLYALDLACSTIPSVKYVRYMDDFLFFTQTRWQLRRIVRRLQQFMTAWGFRLHPDKTFIGRVAKGFDWMGAWLTHQGITGVAPRALINHETRCQRLYERTWHWPKDRQARRVLNYQSLWKRWWVTLSGNLKPSLYATSHNVTHCYSCAMDTVSAAFHAPTVPSFTTKVLGLTASAITPN